MKNSKLYYLSLLLVFVFVFIICLFICLFIYGYNSGSCQVNKQYICNNNFCLYKEFNVILDNIIKNEINNLLINKTIQKRVNITTFPETIFNCALPNKKGITISTSNVIKYAPNLIHFYQNDLCKLV